MQLGTFLDGAKSRPAVTRPVKFKVGAKNTAAQPTSVEVEAVLAYVDEEERAAANIEAAAYLAKKFPGAPIPSAEQRNEESFRLLALALRDKSDPAKPFATAGVDELRPVLLFAVASYLVAEYDDFARAEYAPLPPASDVTSMKGEAAGK